VEVRTGVVEGARFRIEMPRRWNGTLLLYSHGYVSPGHTPRAIVAPNPEDASTLTGAGYALAGSAYRRQGWAVEQALEDQMALLDAFADRYGAPDRTIARGQSMGGLITSLLIDRHPDRFQAAMPMCGVVAGSTAQWNMRLDAAFAFRTLLAPDAPLQLTDIDDGPINAALAQSISAQAQGTPEGRARLALVAAIGNMPGWRPSAPAEEGGYDAQQEAQYRMWYGPAITFTFNLRAEVEARAGGNPSWNVGVDYRQALARSGAAPEVSYLYRKAGLDLSHDLDALAAAPRVSANPRAASYLRRYGTPRRRLTFPVLTLHTTGDAQVPASHESGYADAVAGGGGAAYLRQLYVERGGHCTSSPGEDLAAFSALTARLDDGRWPGWLAVAGPIPRSPSADYDGAHFHAYHPHPFPRETT
jgi:pimeloyl-ACP methyl ester carboxylesterase